jgi:Carboxypeptidase regulatory-like domain
MPVDFSRLQVTLPTVVLLSLWAISVWPQVEVDPPAPRLCTISGVVLNSITGEPIPRALVQVSGGFPGVASALTDSEGRFELANVPESDVTILARKPGFFGDQELHSEGFQPPLIHVSSRTESLVLKLLPEGSISGHVATRQGEPLEDTPIHIFRQRILDGRKRWEPCNQVSADEDGEFRVANLQPGIYLLSAGPTQVIAQRSVSRRAGMNREGIGSLFFPGAPDLESATPLTLAGGQQLQADFSVKLEPMLKVSGTVAGASAVSTSLEVATRSGETLAVPATYDVQTGKFETHVPPGSYVFQVRVANPTGLELGADLPLSVHADLDGVVLVPKPLLNMPVHVEARRVANATTEGAAGAIFEAGSTSVPRPSSDTPPPQLVQVRLIPTELRFQSQEFQAAINPADNTFAVANITPGSYSVEVLPIPPWYVQSAASGNTDVLRDDLLISAGHRPDPLEIVLRDDGANLNGIVRAEGKPVPASILLIPDPSSSEHARLMQAGQGGEFQFDRIPPGDYKLLAFDSLETLEFRNPAAIAPYLARAVRVTVSSGERSEMDLERITVGK